MGVGVGWGLQGLWVGEFFGQIGKESKSVFIFVFGWGRGWGWEVSNFLTNWQRIQI